jgi:hypothetical protein
MIMAKKRRVCHSKTTGKRVSCKRQDAGRKAARARKRGLSGARKGKCLKRSKRGKGGKTRCLKRAKR